MSSFSRHTESHNHHIMWVSVERKRIALFLVLVTTLQMVSWVSATSRPIAAYGGARNPGQSPMSLHATFDPKQSFKSTGGILVNEEAIKSLSTLGSRPPNCQRKCGRCTPCQAIQVPTTTDHLGVQYANYEPEGWKCKCGTSFFNP
ncbi:PREDICTED: EPIDERMAL PATTERNING FACTOR-like protein 6 [Nelumbo nucifera]|uniref:Epidermal patterning factor-like protein n=2 Tax=Nelumbo nucifera TaxID=4432 RepID=A0A822ZIC2_NELNU|nr:PREDICTED: EPIDERMAL PATTERNING FACTOR-like protein 6 [Nelumbo nucifera]DAD44383.1 TPA_asm: hypothetical protein HUJ06_002613 [Nelumbo nucifera]